MCSVGRHVRYDTSFVLLVWAAANERSRRIAALSCPFLLSGSHDCFFGQGFILDFLQKEKPFWGGDASLFGPFSNRPHHWNDVLLDATRSKVGLVGTACIDGILRSPQTGEVFCGSILLSAQCVSRRPTPACSGPEPAVRVRAFPGAEYGWLRPLTLAVKRHSHE